MASVIHPQQSPVPPMWQPPSPGADPDQAAQAWVIRLASGEATQGDAARLATWRAAAQEHEAAFA